MAHPWSARGWNFVQIAGLMRGKFARRTLIGTQESIVGGHLPLRATGHQRRQALQGGRDTIVFEKVGAFPPVGLEKSLDVRRMRKLSAFYQQQVGGGGSDLVGRV